MDPASSIHARTETAAYCEVEANVVAEPYSEATDELHFLESSDNNRNTADESNHARHSNDSRTRLSEGKGSRQQNPSMSSYGLTSTMGIGEASSSSANRHPFHHNDVTTTDNSNSNNSSRPPYTRSRQRVDGDGAVAVDADGLAVLSPVDDALLGTRMFANAVLDASGGVDGSNNESKDDNNNANANSDASRALFVHPPCIPTAFKTFQQLQQLQQRTMEEEEEEDVLSLADDDDDNNNNNGRHSGTRGMAGEQQQQQQQQQQQHSGSSNIPSGLYGCVSSANCFSSYNEQQLKDFGYQSDGDDEDDGDACSDSSTSTFRHYRAHRRGSFRESVNQHPSGFGDSSRLIHSGSGGGVSEGVIGGGDADSRISQSSFGQFSSSQLLSATNTGAANMPDNNSSNGGGHVASDNNRSSHNNSSDVNADLERFLRLIAGQFPPGEQHLQPQLPPLPLMNTTTSPTTSTAVGDGVVGYSLGFQNRVSNITVTVTPRGVAGGTTSPHFSLSNPSLLHTAASPLLESVNRSCMGSELDGGEADEPRGLSAIHASRGHAGGIAAAAAGAPSSMAETQLRQQQRQHLPVGGTPIPPTTGANAVAPWAQLPPFARDQSSLLTAPPSPQPPSSHPNPVARELAGGVSHSTSSCDPHPPVSAASGMHSAQLGGAFAVSAAAISPTGSSSSTQHQPRYGGRMTSPSLTNTLSSSFTSMTATLTSRASPAAGGGIPPSPQRSSMHRNAANNISGQDSNNNYGTHTHMLNANDIHSGNSGTCYPTAETSPPMLAAAVPPLSGFRPLPSFDNGSPPLGNNNNNTNDTHNNTTSIIHFAVGAQGPAWALPQAPPPTFREGSTGLVTGAAAAVNANNNNTDSGSTHSNNINSSNNHNNMGWLRTPPTGSEQASATTEASPLCAVNPPYSANPGNMQRSHDPPTYAASGNSASTSLRSSGPVAVPSCPSPSAAPGGHNATLSLPQNYLPGSLRQASVNTNTGNGSSVLNASIPASSMSVSVGARGTPALSAVGDNSNSKTPYGNGNNTKTNASGGSLCGYPPSPATAGASPCVTLSPLPGSSGHPPPLSPPALLSNLRNNSNNTSASQQSGYGLFYAISPTLQTPTSTSTQGLTTAFTGSLTPQQIFSSIPTLGHTYPNIHNGSQESCSNVHAGMWNLSVNDNSTSNPANTTNHTNQSNSSLSLPSNEMQLMTIARTISPNASNSGAYAYNNNNNNNNIDHETMAARGRQNTFLMPLSQAQLRAAASTATPAPLLLVGLASSIHIQRKYTNVHGSLAGVVDYYSYEPTTGDQSGTGGNGGAAVQQQGQGQRQQPAPSTIILPSFFNNNNAGIDLTAVGVFPFLFTPNPNGPYARRNSGEAHVGVGAEHAEGEARRAMGSPTARYSTNSPRTERQSSNPTPDTAAAAAHNTNHMVDAADGFDLSGCTVYPIFIQMFPCELREQAAQVLNRVIEVAAAIHALAPAAEHTVSHSQTPEHNFGGGGGGGAPSLGTTASFSQGLLPTSLRSRNGNDDSLHGERDGSKAGLHYLVRGRVLQIEPRSETSFIALVATNNMRRLIYLLRCRVLLDRHGFYYCTHLLEHYVKMKEYCETVRRLPQQARHFQTDGLPCMPLVVELARSFQPSSATAAALAMATANPLPQGSYANNSNNHSHPDRSLHGGFVNPESSGSYSHHADPSLLLTPSGSVMRVTVGSHALASSGSTTVTNPANNNASNTMALQQQRLYISSTPPKLATTTSLEEEADKDVPRCFDEIVPMAAVDRHRSRTTNSTHVNNSNSGSSGMRRSLQ